MDEFEFTKFGGAVTGALLAFLSISIFAETLFPSGGHGDEHHNYYATAEAGHGGGEEAKGEEAPAADLATLVAAASAEEGAKVFKKCAACHKVEEGAPNGAGPALYGVMGRQIGTGAGFTYSEALAGKGEPWDWEKLDAFLTKPKDFAPGTKMTFAGLKSPEQRAAVMVYLNEHSGSPIAPPAQ